VSLQCACFVARIQYAHDKLKDTYLKKDERANTTKGPEGERLKLKAEGAFDVMYALRNLTKKEKKE
jgi:hypothetical protein